MADMQSLTLDVSLNIKGFNEANTEAQKLVATFSNLADSLIQSGQKIISTLALITKELDLLGKALQYSGEKLSIFGIQFDVSKDPTQSLKALSDSIQNFKQSLVFGNQDAIKFLAKLIDGFADLINWVNKNIPGLTQVVSILLVVGTTVGGLILAFAAMEAALAAVGVSVGLFLTALGKITFIIGGISAGIITLIQNWDGLVMAAEITWEENIVPIIDSAGQAIANILNAVGQYIEERFYSAVNYISEQWTALINFLRENVPFAESLINALTPDPEAMQDHPTILAIKKSADSRKDWVQGPLGPMPPQQPNQVSIFWAANNQQIRKESEQTAEAVENLNEEVTKTGEELEKAGIKLNFTVGQLSTFKGGTGGVTGQVKQLTDGLGKQAGQLDVNSRAVDENTKRLKEAEEQAKKAEEALKKFEDLELDLELDLLGDSEKLKRELQGRLEEIQRLGEEAGVTQERIVQAQEKEILRSAEAITKALNQEEIERLKNSDSFFDQMKGGFAEFASQVESNGELISQFFANTLSKMSQNFSDLFYNVLTGKFDNLQDLAKQAFEAILRAFLDMVAAIATRQIVISIGGMFGLGKGSQAAGGGSGGPLDLAQQGIGVAGSSAGLFGAGGAFSTFGAGITGGMAAVPGATAAGATASSLTAGAVASTPTAVVPGFMATAGAAITIVGAALAVAGLAYTIIAPFLKKTPRLDIEFDEVKNDIEERAAVVAEFLDPQFFMDNIGRISVKRGGVGIGAGGSNQILELIRERIEETIEGIQDIIAKLPTDMFKSLNETLLGAEIDIDTEIAGERLLEFDAKGKKIAEKFQAFIEGELPAKFFASIRESFFDPAFQALGVSAEGTQALIDDFMAKMEAAGSREARAEVGAEFIATFNAFVDAFNIVSGNVNDSIGQTIQTEECEYRLAA